jgi:hypothetical protein
MTAYDPDRPRSANYDNRAAFGAIDARLAAL